MFVSRKREILRFLRVAAHKLKDANAAVVRLPDPVWIGRVVREHPGSGLSD